MNLHQPSLLRDQFLLDPGVIYLNHGSFGATPRPVFERYQHWQRELEYQPTEFLGRRAPELLKNARQGLARYLGTTSDNLSFVSNATVGMNIIARGLALGEGDEVLATDHEYGAIDRMWRFLSGKLGFKYINQTIRLPVKSKEAIIENIWEGVTTRTRVISISHITSPTALIFPIQEVCQKARETGLITIIDGAHVPGQIPLDLEHLGADFYAGNLHKWLCAPKGAGFLFASSDRLPLVEPLVVSWGWQSENPSGSPLVDYVEWQGTRDISAFLTVPDAIQFQEENRWESVRRACHAMAERSLENMTALTGLNPLSAQAGEWFGQMVSVPIPNQSSPRLLQQRIYEKYRIEVPILGWNGMTLVRFSFQAYNTWDHGQALINALTTELGLLRN